MVGIRSFPIGANGLFSGAFAVSFREGMIYDTWPVKLRYHDIIRACFRWWCAPMFGVSWSNLPVVGFMIQMDWFNHQLVVLWFQKATSWKEESWTLLIHPLKFQKFRKFMKNIWATAFPFVAATKKQQQKSKGAYKFQRLFFCIAPKLIFLGEFL